LWIALVLLLLVVFRPWLIAGGRGFLSSVQLAIPLFLLGEGRWYGKYRGTEENEQRKPCAAHRQSLDHEFGVPENEFGFLCMVIPRPPIAQIRRACCHACFWVAQRFSAAITASIECGFSR
jgi:hypothetical protein